MRSEPRGQLVEPQTNGDSIMPALKDFIPRLGTPTESICSSCCQVVRVSPSAPTLAEAQAQHRCVVFSLNTVTR